MHYADVQNLRLELPPGRDRRIREDEQRPRRHQSTPFYRLCEYLARSMALSASSHYLLFVISTMRSAFQIIKGEYMQLRVGYVQAGAGASMQRYQRKEGVEKLRSLRAILLDYDDRAPLEFLRSCAHCAGTL